MPTTKLTWARPELLQGDTYAAMQTALVLVSERTREPSNAHLEHQCREAIKWLDSGAAPNHVVERWRPAYAMVITALGA